jgi:hypothetical protein
MLLVNLSHDPMMHPLTRVADVQQVMVDHKQRYKQAAARIGLTPREYDEMERRIASGEVKRTTLPVRLDAMAALRHGSVYAISDVRVLPSQTAYAVVLSDGKRVYIPAECGNLSVVSGAPTRIARKAPAQRTLAHRPAHYVLARRSVAPDTAVPGSTDTAAVVPVAPGAPAVVAAAPVPETSSRRSFHVPGFGWIGAVVGGIAAWWSGGNTPSPPTGVCLP